MACRLEQLVEIVLITRIDTGVTRRINARRAAERIDRDAGIVGQRRPATDTRSVTGLYDGVFDEGGTGFFDTAHCEVRLRTHRDWQAGQHRDNLAQFAGIAARQYQLHAQRARAASCSSNN